jgi:hypothetical protein
MTIPQRFWYSHPSAMGWWTTSSSWIGGSQVSGSWRENGAFGCCFGNTGYGAYSWSLKEMHSQSRTQTIPVFRSAIVDQILRSS